MAKTKQLTYRIIKESFFILILTSILSTLGGISLESIQKRIFNFLPFLIALPAINDMIGDFGGIISSKFTTLLFLGVVERKWWKTKELISLFLKIIITSFFSSIYLIFLVIIFSLIKGSYFDFTFYTKFVLSNILVIIVLVVLISLVSILGGLSVYKKNRDPDNYLIPITTSISDILTMIIISLVIRWFFK
jgi:mgtE-like transporter